MQEQAIKEATAEQTKELRDQITMLRQQLNEKDARLDSAVMKLNSQSSNPPRGSSSNQMGRVVKAEPADTTT